MLDDFGTHWNYYVAMETTPKISKISKCSKLYKNFTVMMTNIGRCGIWRWNFQNICCYHGNNAKRSKISKKMKMLQTGLNFTGMVNVKFSLETLNGIL